VNYPFKNGLLVFDVKNVKSIRKRSACCVCVHLCNRKEHFILKLLLLPIMQSNSFWHWITNGSQQKQPEREQRKRNEGSEREGNVWEGHQESNHMLLARKFQLVFIHW